MRETIDQKSLAANQILSLQAILNGTSNFIVTGMTEAGRSYEEAVKLFSPYTEVKDLNPGVRTSLRELVRIAQDKRTTAFLFVNNRLEGNAPATIVAITEP